MIIPIFFPVESSEYVYVPPSKWELDRWSIENDHKNAMREHLKRTRENNQDALIGLLAYAAGLLIFWGLLF